MTNLGLEIEKLICSDVLENELLSKHTSYRIGGPADLFVRPESVLDLAALIPWLRHHGVPYFVLGGGTNLLVSDKGMRNVVVQIAAALDFIEIEGTKIHSGAGTRLGGLVRAAAEASLTGLECETAVPGSVGGAVVMNAGTHRGYLDGWCTGIQIMRNTGSVEWIACDEAHFGYRDSIFQHSDELIVLAMRGQLRQGSREEITASMEQLFQRRRDTQPTEPSAGSVFRNPPGEHAARFIQEAGAKGMRIGDAMVSPMHANFIVNAGEARAEDVCALIDRVREMVRAHAGIQLETEIKLVGDWSTQD